MTIGFVGLTHLGLISGAAALKKGNKVVFFDLNENLIKDLKRERYPIKEPGFSEAIRENNTKAVFTSNLKDLESCDIVYISPDIPTNDKGESDLLGIKNLIDKTYKYWPKKGSIVVLSQVKPGFTREISTHLRKKGVDISKFYYQVETLVFGIAMQRALYPERYIIGLADEKQSLCETLKKYLDSYDCPILPMKYESAEFCKICINAFLAGSVTVSNTLEEICEKIGARWKEITPALRLDKRIGKYAYLNSGLGISGGNIERDLSSILSLSNEKATESSTIEGFIRNSHYRKDWPLRVFYEKVIPKMNSFPRVGFLGISYKENTHSIKNSPSVRLMKKLKIFDSCAYDPKVKILPPFLDHVSIKNHMEDVINSVEVLFVMTPWKEFEDISLELILKAQELKFVIDPSGILHHVVPSEKEYFSFC